MRKMLLALFLVGCSGPAVVGDAGPDDAGPVDGGSDAGVDAGTGGADCGTPAGTAKITLFHHSGLFEPAAGLQVIIHCPDGRWSQVLSTDANGLASAQVVAGAMVTAVIPDESGSGPVRLVTVEGVQPGDDIVVEPRPPQVLAFGARAQAADGGSHPVTLGNRTGTGGLVHADCLFDGGFTAFATNIDGRPWAAVNVALAEWDGGALQLTDGDGGVTPLGVVLTGDQARFVSLVPDSVMGMRVGNQRFTALSTAAWVSQTSWRHDVASRFAEYVDYSIGVTWDAGFGGVYHQDPAGSHTIDLDTEVLPNVYAASMSPRGEITWSATGDLSVADAVFISAFGQSHEWVVMAPASVSAPLTLPALPPALGEDGGWGLRSVQFIEADWLDYAALKRAGLDLSPPTGGVWPLPPRGRHAARSTGYQVP